MDWLEGKSVLARCVEFVFVFLTVINSLKCIGIIEIVIIFDCNSSLTWTGSAGLPEKDSCWVEMEVEHVLSFKTDITSEVLTNDALPGWEESFIEQLLELFSEIDVLELGGSGCFLLYELNRLQSHIYIIWNRSRNSFDNPICLPSAIYDFSMRILLSPISPSLLLLNLNL